MRTLAGYAAVGRDAHATIGVGVETRDDAEAAGGESREEAKPTRTRAERVYGRHLQRLRGLGSLSAKAGHGASR